MISALALALLASATLCWPGAGAVRHRCPSIRGPIAIRPSAGRDPPSARLLGGLLLAAVVSVVVSVAAGTMLATGLVAVGWARSRAGRRAAEAAMVAVLPEAIDLCTVVLGAGGTVRDCVDALAATGPGPVRPLAAEAQHRADCGAGLDEALRWFLHELGPSFQPLTGSLLLAREQGGSIAALLSRLAVEASASRRRLGEQRARRLPVALLIPLVTCSLPAVIVGSVVPFALVAFRSLQL